jgi:hypothetical protein
MESSRTAMKSVWHCDDNRANDSACVKSFERQRLLFPYLMVYHTGLAFPDRQPEFSCSIRLRIMMCFREMDRQVLSLKFHSGASKAKIQASELPTKDANLLSKWQLR